MIDAERCPRCGDPRYERNPTTAIGKTIAYCPRCGDDPTGKPKGGIMLLMLADAAMEAAQAHGDPKEAKHERIR